MKNEPLRSNKSSGNFTRLEEYKEQIIRSAAEQNLYLISEKEIPYGLQIVIGTQEVNVPLNIYYSEKKGISTVIGGKEFNPLKPLLTEMILSLTVDSTQKNIHSWDSWLGTDEAGKGEFYGALVVAGFHTDKDIIPELQRIGVKDSKKITRDMIDPIAHKLYKAFKERIGVVSLNPLTYNKLYNDFNHQQKKLNEMMAWMHGRVILNLLEKTGENRVVVDKFTTDAKLLKTIKDLEKIELLQIPQAERDLGVAAASIIARYHYLDSLKMLSKKFRLEFKSGSGKQSLETGVTFVKKYSLAKLQEVAKTHFKNFEKIKEKLQTEKI